MTIKKPIIGITLDHCISPTYAAYPWYALRQNYFDAVHDAGGIAIALPYNHGAIDSYLGLIDGLLMPGGDDMDSGLYGKARTYFESPVNALRSGFDYAILKKAVTQKIPFLGICAGLQMLNVVQGGSLHQHIPHAISNALKHEQKIPNHIPSHAITIETDTRLHAMAGDQFASVNSTHHQAIDRLGHTLRVSAYAPDGVIEAIELQDHFFCMGVQWHPEYQTTDLDRILFSNFIRATL